MIVTMPEAVIVGVVSVFLFLALCAALVLVTISLRRPANLPLLAAAILVVLCLLAVVVLPWNVPLVVGLALAALGTALAALGGDPITRRVLDIATHGTVRDGVHGGILVDDADGSGEDAVHEVMRGGTTIGYLERLGALIAIVAGFPEAIAVIVAVKGIGRFSELASPAARERFIIGTLASLLWACVVGGLVRLAIW
ncbi:hypothetical protein [Microbacterium awajiense]